ncbi:hypothetical protein Agub_g9899, partial [Astrephomene gubernaculifera]
MPRPDRAADAAAVFQEAKKLIEEGRRSRQRSPLRLAPEDRSSSLLENFSPQKASFFTSTNPLTAPHFLSSAWPTTTTSIASLAPSWQLPDAPAVDDLGREWPAPHPHLAASPLKTPPPAPPPQDEDSGDNDAADADDDQPSRWQVLVRRANTNAANSPGLTALCPSRHSPLSPSPTRDRLLPPAPRSDAAAGPGGLAPLGSLYDGMGAGKSGLYGEAWSQGPYARDQYDKTVRMSPQAAGPQAVAGSVWTGQQQQQPLPQRPLSHLFPSSLPAPSLLMQAGGRGGEGVLLVGRVGAGVAAGKGGSSSSSSYERAVAALQQAEQQLQEHKQGGPGGAVGGRGGGRA